MSLMRDETLEAPAAVARCLAQGKTFDAIAADLRKLDPPFVVVCARGSSSHAGTYLQVLLSKQLGLFAGAVMPSIASVYRRRQRLKGALFIAISQSGRSPDLLAATALARETGALTLAIVNDTASPLAQECDVVLDIAAGEERSVAATKTVLATLAAGIALVDAWEPGAARPALDALPQRLAAAAALDWSRLVDTLAAVPSIFTDRAVVPGWESRARRR